MARRKGTAGGRRRYETKNRPPTFRGWISTGEDEVKRREWRGWTQIDEVRVLDREHGPFADYRVASASGSAYVVEVRSLAEHGLALSRPFQEPSVAGPRSPSRSAL